MKEALKLALEALINAIAVRNGEGGTKLVSPLEENAITAIKEALAQPAQEPVVDDLAIAECLAVLRPAVKGKFPQEQALEELVGYTTPPKRPWVGLMDEEIEEAYAKPTLRKMYQAIEAKLKELNT